jgi:hypothetical protein
MYQERSMNVVNPATWRLVGLFVLTIIAACGDNNIALIGRETLTGREVPDEIVGTVERLDTSSRELHLRGMDRRSRVVSYSEDTPVMYRGREYPVTQLAAGDIVALQLKQDARGNSYTDLIRVQETNRRWSQDHGENP